MKYQILRFNRSPEAFYFVREDFKIRQWDSLEEAKAAAQEMATQDRDEIEHVVVTVHVCYRHKTTYVPKEPIHEVREYNIEGPFDSMSTRYPSVTR